MIAGFLYVTVLIAALGCGLVAGVFFAFSTFVMQALARLPPSEGIAAMQSINAVVLASWFMVAFFGTAAACAVVLIYSLFRWPEPGAVYLFAGSVFYLAGSVLVTVVFNVPRNKALASLAPAAPESSSRWASYISSWTIWNHVRTAASLAAAASFSIALG